MKMKNDVKSSLTGELIRAIYQTDEWDRIWTQDPAIREARAQLDTIIEPIESKDLRDSLWDAIFELTTACEYAATRYGARVTLALLNAAGNPF